MKTFRWFLIFLLMAVLPSALAGTPDLKKYGIRFVDEGTAHSTPPSGYGELYVNSDVLYFITDGGTATNLLASLSNNTLDQAYDQGGAGSGKAITVDSGAIALANTDADTAWILTLNASPSGSAALGGLQITCGANSTQDALEFANSGTGYDIYGTGGLWKAAKTGTNTFTPAAGSQSIVIDAATTDNTGTSGLIDIDVDTVTNGFEGINIDIDMLDTAAGSEIITGVLVDLDDDTADFASTARGFSAISSDLTGNASTVVQGFYTSGCDVAFQSDNGYVRIGTGSTPGVTPGDDDIFIEGTAEIDGVFYPDGGITGLGTASVAVGLARKHESYVGAGNTITIAESGTVFDNTGDADGSLHTLPEASTAIGCVYTFAVTAAQALVVELDDADVFLHLTLDAGDQIQSSTIGDTITVMAVDATNWIVLSAYPAASDWADGGA